jgi:RNA polymerase sigma-70 factor (ECF subfamily)
LAAIAPLAPTIDEDAEAVARYRQGDARAFDGLVRKYQRPIYYLALRYVKQPDDAKDVAQRAFVRAFQALGGFRGASTFKTWLYRIAVNLALNHIRDHAREKPSEIPEDALVADAIGTARLADAEERRRLIAALEHLPPQQRLVVELRVFQDLAFKEVADIAECSENSAKVSFHHAVKKLRERLVGGDT